MVVDYRHSLLGVVPDEYIGARGGSADLVAGQVEALTETLRSRMPPADLTPTQLAERGWWTGPELYVVADDYDLAVGSMGRGPLAPWPSSFHRRTSWASISCWHVGSAAPRVPCCRTRC